MSIDLFGYGVGGITADFLAIIDTDHTVVIAVSDRVRRNFPLPSRIPTSSANSAIAALREQMLGGTATVEVQDERGPRDDQ